MSGRLYSGSGKCKWCSYYWNFVPHNNCEKQHLFLFIFSIMISEKVETDSFCNMFRQIRVEDEVQNRQKLCNFKFVKNVNVITLTINKLTCLPSQKHA